MNKSQNKNIINVLHIELGHPSEEITQDREKALGLKVTSKFNPCKDCDLGKAKKWCH